MQTGPIDFAKHVRLSEAILFGALSPQKYDPNRMVLLYFALATVSVAGKVTALAEEKVRGIIEWIYAQQVPEAEGGGFRSTHTMGGVGLEEGHATMTQCALLSLIICGDDLARVDKKAVATHLRKVQAENGCFRSLSYGESDVRMMYSACVTCHLLDLWDSIDKEAAIQYLVSCQSYDGGFGWHPGSEGHGGNTFCCLASLALLGALDRVDTARAEKFLVMRATAHGFNGRPNKDADTCYTYWVGTSLALLQRHKGAEGFVPVDAGLLGFVAECQDAAKGGIAKDQATGTDLLHTALSLMGLRNLQLVDSCPPLDLRLGCLAEAVPV